MTAKEFNLQLDKALLDTDDKINDAISVISMYCLSGIVRKSPVDTGRFRGNWIVSKNQPNTQVRKTTDKGGSNTINKGSSAIEAFDYKGDLRIIIQNNLPYANRLENGWSKQAPNGMVALTINEASQRYREILL